MERLWLFELAEKIGGMTCLAQVGMNGHIVGIVAYRSGVVSIASKCISRT